jgi:DHA2 family multidrug resistance protein
VAFVIRELRVPVPAVNLRILKNWGFTAGTVFAMILGFGLYGGVFIIPIYLQQLRHYTAAQTGWIIFPGGIATALIMPFIGKLVNKFSPRNLVLIGASGFIASMLLLYRITMDTGPDQLFWPLVLRGASMGFLFLPLNLATLLGLQIRDVSAGAGLFNLARQLGGSAGIAYLSTLVDHHTAFHRATLVEHVSMYDPATLERIRGIQGGLMANGTVAGMAKQQAVAVVDRMVQGQAAILAFEDAFLMIAIVFACSLPLLFLLKKGRPSALRGAPISE